MQQWLTDRELHGNLVLLIPLKKQHNTDLVKAASDGHLWNLWYTSIPSQNTVDVYIDEAIKMAKEGTGIAFAVVDRRNQQIIGCTRYCHASQFNRVEIGYTWYSQSVQRTGINTECKFLLLRHAFEKMNCIAVEFRTHWHNLASRGAIARLGAKQDGVLRNHSMDATGIMRDTVVFSIIQSEWPAVKKSLQYKLDLDY